MVDTNAKFVAIICLCCIGAHSTAKERAPWVWPRTFVDDGRQEQVEFTCGAHLKPGDKLQWHRITKYDGTNYRELSYEETKQTTGIKQTVEGHGTINLIWPLALLSSGDRVYCVKQTSNTYVFGEKFESHTVNIIFTKDRFKSIDIKTTYGFVPWLTPKTFVDDGKREIEITCYAYLYENRLLTWYQTQNAGEGKPVKLSWIKQEADYGYVKLRLRKKLEPSDNGTQIYCGAEQKDGNGYTWTTLSTKIQIMFQKNTAPEETPHVTVEPNTGIIFFDEEETLEFVCKGSKHIISSRLSWYLQDFLSYQQSFHSSTNINHLTLPVRADYHGMQLLCVQEFEGKKSEGNVTMILKNRELARSRPMTLLHRAQCDPAEKLKVTPDYYEDDGGYIQFTCYAFLQMGETLSWYQKKEGSESDILLRTVQLQDPRFGGQWMVLDLKKTLEPTDKDSEIYCAKINGELRDISDGIVLEIDSVKNIQPLEPASVIVEPNVTDVYFDVGTTRQFKCIGSEPVDGRNYTWYINGSESGPITSPEIQKYDASTNTNVLNISFNEAHHLKKLFCAQGFFTYIQNKGRLLQGLLYGELVTSHKINLIKAPDKTSPATTPAGTPEETAMTPNTKTSPPITVVESPTTSEANSEGGGAVSHATIYAVVIPLVLVTLVAVGLALWALCGRRAPHQRRAPPARAARAAPPAPANTGNNEDIYVNLSRPGESPEVTYAVLDLPRKKPAVAPRPKPAPEATLYAEIVGVCNK